MTRRLAALVLWLAGVPAAAASDPLEGDWQVNGGGASLRFETGAYRDGSLDIVWLDGPALDIAPGTRVGSAVPGAGAGVYDCRMEACPGPSGKRSRATFVLRLGPDADSFVLEPYRRNRRISLRRLLPYLFRVAVIERSDRPSGLDGGRRLGSAPKFIVL